MLVQPLLRLLTVSLSPTTLSPFGHLRALEKQKVGLSNTCAGDPCPRETVFFFTISQLLCYTLEAN